MTIQIQFELWQVVSAACGAVVVIVPAAWALARMVVRQIGAHLDKQDERMTVLESQVTALRVEVATQYVRREDFVREIAMLATKFENLAINVERKVETLAREGLHMIQQALKELRR